MRRYAVPGLIIAIAAGLLVVLALGVSSRGNTGTLDSEVAHGQTPPAPNQHMALQLLGSSKRTTLASLHGKVVLLNVFASWCTPCQTEAPLLRHAQALLQAHNGTVVGVTYQDNAANDLNFVHKYHLNYPVLRDVSGNFAQGLGVTGVPESFLINRKGEVQVVQRFQLTSKSLDKILTKALAG